MKAINWNKEKNNWLKAKRGVSFEDILFYLSNEYLIEDIEHPNKRKYPNQRMMLFDVKGYIYVVPYVETIDEIFLKTIIPSRSATKKYLENKNGR